MPHAGRPSEPGDRGQITALMVDAMGIGPGDAAVAPEMQQWKYWQDHPLAAGRRSWVLFDERGMVAHGAKWPIQLRGGFGERPAFHLIDWAAQRGSGGSGMEVLQLCGEGSAAVFSIGGSALTRKIVPIFGFRPQNRIAFLLRPLHPFRPAWDDSPRDWKLPARIMRNLAHYLPASATQASDWTAAPVVPSGIPEALFPAPAEGEVVAVRTAPLLHHIMGCPRFRNSRCYLLRHGSEPSAYFVLAQVGSQVRLLDFGPSGLDETSGYALAIAAQREARHGFPAATSILAATTEPAVEAGFVRAGLRVGRTEIVKVLKLDAGLKAVTRYRLTLLDWDAACL